MSEKKKATSFPKVIKIKHLGINLRKQFGGFYNWCYKILLKKERESGMIDTLCLWTERITIDNMIMLLKETYRLNISSHHSHWQTTVFKETEKFPKSLWINIFQSFFHLFLAGWLAGLAWHSVVTPLNHTGSCAQSSPCSHICFILPLKSPVILNSVCASNFLPLLWLMNIS